MGQDNYTYMTTNGKNRATFRSWICDER